MSTTTAHQPPKHTLRQGFDRLNLTNQSIAFTGQYSFASNEATDLGDSGFGLMYYSARMYDPALGRFTSADTPSTSSGQRIIPSTQGVQGWDRYAYVNNNPVRYTDPTGHICVNDDGDGDVAMAGNCGGGANVHYNGGLQGPGNILFPIPMRM